MHHGDTEVTEEFVVSLAGRLRPGKKSIRLRRKALYSNTHCRSSANGGWNLPGGLRSYARSSSPDRA